MKQTVRRRLEGLERISSAAVARQPQKSPEYQRKIAAIVEDANRWHADPANQKWLAEQPPDFLANRMQQLRHALHRRAYGASA
jgi:hypothetical protein